MTLGEGYYDSWVLARGVRTHYYYSGTEGPAVVLLHGGGPGTSGEAGFARMLPALAAGGYRAIAPDQLSMGWTDARPHAWPLLAYQSLVNHVADFIDALCLDEVSVVGNSQGAYVAAKYALDHPERVDKAFFISSATIATSIGIEAPVTDAMRILRSYDYTPEAMRAFLLSIVHRPEVVTDELVAARHKAAMRPGIRESRAAFVEGRRRVEGDKRLWNQFCLDDQLPRLSIPARFVWGKEDKFAPIELGYELQKKLPDIPFTYIEDCGHQAQNDQPEIVNDMVFELLGGA